MRLNILSLAAFIVASAAQTTTCAVVDPSVDHSKWFTPKSGSCTTTDGVTSCSESALAAYFSAPGCNNAGTVRIKSTRDYRTIILLKGTGGAVVGYYADAGKECTASVGIKHISSFSTYLG
ncbi:hypothetical protein CGMCC3_g15100 [Colletotrichum fructicola]|uniref:Secreted protein n=1 Tax=Colletotrichum fructicola (strain Nara gc5) TaxID=1213859 RepID=L2G1E7_COLFN|nr:uncharacterized protein CGMCC3_g15100 [Colletotrichum fructicola]KAE9568791.1 hypothetical protein CGMCC3_g15100 [Colletotrichum fructicola]KAF4492806.1 hypothetical protein CGGC5_v002597 [Colletotrichum fructicola Nara gc5]